MSEKQTQSVFEEPLSEDSQPLRDYPKSTQVAVKEEQALPRKKVLPDWTINRWLKFLLLFAIGLPVAVYILWLLAAAMIFMLLGWFFTGDPFYFIR